ncbi:hypothetical protein [Microlunatus sp. Y2014]|uniref:hypothetical protein n=1 Tax=Microlunatus sp. Y2014 TaxID=3418488 RepID=UPI003DA727BC
MITIDINHFRARVLQDCLSEATAAYWRGRAQTFEDARPKATDYNGRATSAQLAAKDAELAAIAAACRARALVAEAVRPEPISVEITEALKGVA